MSMVWNHTFLSLYGYIIKTSLLLYSIASAVRVRSIKYRIWFYLFYLLRMLVFAGWWMNGGNNYCWFRDFFLQIKHFTDKTMSTIDGGGSYEDDNQQRHEQQLQQLQQQHRGDKLQSGTADERGWQRHSENVAERTDLTETVTGATDVVVVTATKKNDRDNESSSDVSVSAVAATAEHAASTAQVQVSSIPVGQLINVSADGTYNVVSTNSYQVQQKLPFEINYKLLKYYINNSSSLIKLLTSFKFITI